MKPAGTLRLFLALWPDDGARAALARCRDAWDWDAGASPEPTARLHLTLHFLGAVRQLRLPELIEGLKARTNPFALCLDQTQRWPNGVAVLAPKAAPPGLLALHAALRDGLECLDLATETRRYRPHVTLARRVGDSAAPAQTSPVHWPVSGYALVESHPVTGEYVMLRHFG